MHCSRWISFPRRPAYLCSCAIPAPWHEAESGRLCHLRNEQSQLIALFTVAFFHLHYNVFERECEAISGNCALFARNCLTSTFKYIVMQMRKVNCEKGY